MNRHTISRGFLLALTLSVAAPRPVQALDLASTTTALAGGGLAIAGAVMKGSDDSSVSEKGSRFLTAGLIISGVFCSSAVVLDLLFLGFYYDRIEQLELEMAAGGGPMIDALSTGFSVPRADVIATIQDTQRQHPLRTDADAQAFMVHLVHGLGNKMTLGEDLALSTLYALHQERRDAGSASAPHYAMLASHSGVPADALAAIVTSEIDGYLSARQVPGEILSARALLAQDPVPLMNTILGRIAVEHADLLSSQIHKSVEAFSALYPELAQVGAPEGA